MAINLGDGYMTFRADMTQLQASFGTLESTVSGVRSTISQHSTAIGLAMTTAGGAITGSLGLAAKSAGTFGSAMAEIAALGFKDMDGLAKTVKEAAGAYGIDLMDAVHAAKQAFSSGVSEDNIGAFIKKSAEAAIAGTTTMTTAIEHGSAMVNAFGGDVSTYFDQAFVAVNKGVLEFEDLNSTMGKIIPIFKAAGLSTKEMYAAVAALTTQGMSCEESVTGLRSAIGNIIKPSESASKVAEALGIDFNTVALRTKGLGGFLDEVKQKINVNGPAMAQLAKEAKAQIDAAGGQTAASKALQEQLKNQIAVQKEHIKTLSENKGAHGANNAAITEAKNKLEQLQSQLKNSSGGMVAHKEEIKKLRETYKELKDVSDDEITTMAVLFGDIQGLNAALSLASTGGSAKFKEAMVDMNKEGSALAYAFQQIKEKDPTIAFKQLQSQLQVLSVEVGNAVLPALGKMVEFLTPIVQGVIQFTQAHPALVAGLAMTAGGIGALMLVAGPMLIMFNQAKQVWDTFRTSTKEAKAALDQTAVSVRELSAEERKAEADAKLYGTAIAEAERKIKGYETEIAAAERAQKGFALEMSRADVAADKLSASMARNGAAVDKTKAAYTEAEVKLASSKAKVADLNREYDQLVMSEKDTTAETTRLNAELMKASAELATNETKVSQTKTAYDSAEIAMGQARTEAGKLTTQMGELAAKHTAAGADIDRFKASLERESIELRKVKVDAEVAGVSLDKMGTHAHTTGGKVANLGGKIGDAGGLAQDIAQMLGVSSPAIDKIAELGNVASQAGMMFGGGGAAAGAAGAGGAGLSGGIAATTAAIAGPGALLVAGAAAIIMLGGIAIAAKKAWDAKRELKKGTDENTSSLKLATDQLDRMGVSYDKAKMATMSLAQQQDYVNGLLRANDTALASNTAAVEKNAQSYLSVRDSSKAAIDAADDQLRRHEITWDEYQEKVTKAMYKSGEAFNALKKQITDSINAAAKAGDSLAAFFQGLTPNPNANYTPPGQNATGTDNWRGGLTWVGESGKELVNLPQGAQIFDSKTSAAMAGAGSFGGGITIQGPLISGVSVSGNMDVDRLASRMMDKLQEKLAKKGIRN